MSPRNRYVDSHSQVASSTIFAAVRCSSSLGPKRKRSSASSSRPVPATTPYRRPFSSRRACTSKIARIPAVPLRSAPSSIVSSYWSVNNALQGSCGAAVFTDNPGWKPRCSGRGGMPGPPDCRTRPRDWAGVPVPPVPDAGAGDGVARALRPGPVRLEPGAGAGQLLRHRRPQGLPELRRAVSATDRGPGGAPVAGRRQPDRPAAGPARSRPGLAQGRPARRRSGSPRAGRVRRLNRRWAEVGVPKVGWVRFRLSRAIPDAKSYRVTRDSAGRWHIAFAAIPAAIPAPGTGEVVGADRGVAVAAALATGELRRFDTDSLDAQVRRTQRRLGRAQPGSNRCRRVKARLARRQRLLPG